MQTRERERGGGLPLFNDLGHLPYGEGGGALTRDYYLITSGYLPVFGEGGWGRGSEPCLMSAHLFDLMGRTREQHQQTKQHHKKKKKKKKKKNRGERRQRPFFFFFFFLTTPGHLPSCFFLLLFLGGGGI